MPDIYLAGPITGLSIHEACDWRDAIVPLFADRPDIRLVSPLRAKREFLEAQYGNNPLTAHSVADSDKFVLSSDHGIFRRDFNDVFEADLILINFLGAKQISIGTCFELAWAWHARIPTVVVMEKEGNPHEHCFVREAIDFRVSTIEEAVMVAKAVLFGEPVPHENDSNFWKRSTGDTPWKSLSIDQWVDVAEKLLQSKLDAVNLAEVGNRRFGSISLLADPETATFEQTQLVRRASEEAWRAALSKLSSHNAVQFFAMLEDEMAMRGEQVL